MHIVNVSDFNSNSGLYALGLAIRLAIEANSSRLITNSNIPPFVQQIRAVDLADAQNTTAVQKKLADSLRLQMAAALNNDAEFKKKSLHAFTQLCLSSNEVSLVGMETFIKGNEKFISDLNASFKKIESYKKSIGAFNSISIKEEKVKALETKLIEGMNSDMFVAETVLLYCSGELSATNVNELYKVCKLFALACDKIDQNTPNRQDTVNVLEKWFSSRASAIYSAQDGDNKYKQLVLLGLCATLVGRSIDPLYNAKEMYVKFILEKSWDDIYGNYVMHIGSRDSMFSADELGCLAAHWNIQLITQEASKNSSNLLLNPSLTVTLTNDTGNRWSVSADDTLLEPVPQEQDDKFKTLLILSETFKEILTGVPSSSKPSVSYKIIRDSFITLKNATGELLLKPINRRNSLSFNDSVEGKEIEKKQSIETQNNSVLWAFKHRNPAFSTATRANLVGGFAAATLLESSAAVAGLYGVEGGVVFARAVQVGRVAGTTFEAAHLGAAMARVLINPFMMGPIALLEAGMLSRRKLNEFSGSIKKALELYKTAINENDKEKLKQVDEMLRAEIGKGPNGRWPQTRLAIWMQSSNDQCALVYYILGKIANEVAKDDDAGLMFKKACYYAKDENLKWLSIFGLTRTLLRAKQTDAIGNELLDQELTTAIHKNIELLNTPSHEMVVSVFNDVMNTLNYILGVVCLQKNPEALVNIEKILNNTDIGIVKHFKPYGKLCEIIFTFVQGVGLELKAIELRKVVTENVTPLESDIYLMCEAYRKSVRKFTDCASIILNAEQDGEWVVSETRKIVLVEEIRNYCRRFFENCHKENIIEDNVTNLVRAYRLDDKSVLEEDKHEELMKSMMARKNRRRNAGLD